MLILLVCVEDEKFWLFDSESANVHNLQTLNINVNKSKYDDVKVDNLNASFNYWYNKNVYNICFDKGNTPQTFCSQLEYEYVKIREANIKFLNFIHNEIDGLVYDFKINNLKIQEKVGSVNRKTHIIKLHKNGGIINKFDGTKKMQTSIPYNENNNNFYWFNIPDRNTFYVVPEIELLDYGFISTKDNIGKKHMCIGRNNRWLQNYKFYYDTINEEDNKEELMLILGLI
jgi:hypothetical protein